MSAKQATCSSEDSLNITDTGSSCVAMCYRITPILQNFTSHETASTCNTPYRPRLWRTRGRARMRLFLPSQRMKGLTNSKLTAQRVPKNGSDPYRKSSSGHIMKATVSRSHCQFKMSSKSKRVPYWTLRTRSRFGLLTTVRHSPLMRYVYAQCRIYESNDSSTSSPSLTKGKTRSMSYA
jgi:hypothetical protein